MRTAFRFLLALSVALPISGAELTSNSNRFAVAGLNEAEVRSFFELLQDAVRAERNEQLADLFNYPFTVYASSGERVIRDRAQFLSDPAVVFNKRVREQILSQRFDDLFANWQGVMIGRGVLWFGGICDPGSPPDSCLNYKIRIYAINQDAPM